MRKCPSSSVVAVRRSGPKTSMDADGTTAPEESTTTPAMTPLACPLICPFRPSAESRARESKVRMGIVVSIAIETGVLDSAAEVVRKRFLQNVFERERFQYMANPVI